jgi:D-alanyl-D-alanine carboxypeptidase/D-alanyl-D-alanine-endopeptidase (penicillin-binding protein 4)
MLKNKGIKHLKGNIIIDDKYFELPFYAPGWTQDSIPWGYSAPVSAIILNENKIKLKFDAVNKFSEKIKVEYVKEEPFLALPLKTHVISASLQATQTICQLNASIKNNSILLSGCWAQEKTPTFIELAIDNPSLFIQQYIHYFLKKLNIQFQGQILFAKAPPNLPLIAIKHSVPLKEILIKILADSNNIYTESLTKTLGYAYFGQGSFQAGVLAISNILKKEYDLEILNNFKDGSGQSRYNLITPSLITNLLYQLYHDPLFPYFYNALSINGQKGTLMERLKDENMKGKVIAKTGSAMGTSALSGYLRANNNEEYLFSILINQADKNGVALKNFEDKLCELMVMENWPKNSKDNRFTSIDNNSIFRMSFHRP